MDPALGDVGHQVTGDREADGQRDPQAAEDRPTSARYTPTQRPPRPTANDPATAPTSMLAAARTVAQIESASNAMWNTNTSLNAAPNA